MLLSVKHDVSLAIRLAILRMLLKAGGELNDEKGNPVRYFLKQITNSSFQKARAEDKEIELLHKEFENANLNKVDDAKIDKIFEYGFREFINDENTRFNLLVNKEFLQLALHYGVNIGLLFDYACQNRVRSIALDFFLDHGANVNQVNEDNYTPLFHVIENPNICGYLKEGMVVKLLKKGANVDYQNINGLTALMLAFKLGQYALSSLLIQWSAKINFLIELAFQNNNECKSVRDIIESLPSQYPERENILNFLPLPVDQKEIDEKKPNQFNNAKKNQHHKLRKRFDQIWDDYITLKCELGSEEEDVLYKGFCDLEKHFDNVNGLSKEVSKKLVLVDTAVNKSVVDEELKSLQNRIDECKKEIEASIETLNRKLVDNEKSKFGNNKNKYYDALSKLEAKIQNSENPVVMDDTWGDDNPEEEKINKPENFDDDDSGGDDEEDNTQKAKLLIRKYILLQIAQEYNWTISERSSGSSTELLKKITGYNWVVGNKENHYRIDKKFQDLFQVQAELEKSHLPKKQIFTETQPDDKSTIVMMITREQIEQIQLIQKLKSSSFDVPHLYRNSNSHAWFNSSSSSSALNSSSTTSVAQSTSGPM